MLITFLDREYEMEPNETVVFPAYHPIAIDNDTSMTLSVICDKNRQSWICRLRWGFDETSGAIGGRCSCTIERNEPTVADAVKNVDTAVRVLLKGLGQSAHDTRDVSIAAEGTRLASILAIGQEPVVHRSCCKHLIDQSFCNCGAEISHLRKLVNRYEVLILLYDATVFVVRSMEHLLPDFIRSQIKACLEGHKELIGEPPMRSRYEKDQT